MVLHPELQNLVAAPVGMLDISSSKLPSKTMWNTVDVHFMLCVKQKCKSASHEGYIKAVRYFW